MILLVKKLMILFCGGIFLTACGTGERRIEGEMAFDSGSLMNMAESFLTAGDYANAMRLYQRAATENSQHIPSRLGLAKTYQVLGATDAAINFYDQVLTLDPENNEARLGVAQMLITKNRPNDALPYLDELSRKDPKNYRIYNLKGLAHDLLGEQERAQLSYGQGLDFAPDNISLLNNLALSFAFEGQYATAIPLLSKAINLDYSVTKAQQNLVLVYVLSGEEEAGRKIGANIMTAEEMENNIRHYKWVKTLPPKERAQAIYLGIKNFPKDEVINPVGNMTGDKAVAAPLPDDPKKRKLLELLKQEKQLAIENEVKKTPEKLPEKLPEKIIQSSLEKAVITTPLDYIYRVQLASYPNTAIAQKGWQKIKRRSDGLLDPYDPLIQLVTLANGKTLFRLFIGGIDQKPVARNICDQLRDSKVDCLVLKTLRK